jgi:hypothetical protein
LRRPDGSVVGYFPIWSMNPERIFREAELDLASAHLANSSHLLSHRRFIDRRFRT